MLKKAIALSVVLSVIILIILNASSIISFFQGSPYRRVVVSEGQLSVENFGSESSPKPINFIKEGVYLYVTAGLTLEDMKTYVPTKGDTYHINGFDIIVSEVHSDWFLLLVKPEWQ
jgi:hypothetical protein